MGSNIFFLEPLQKQIFDTNRRRVKKCPCGKGNADGKFTPYKGFDNRGYCHSCGIGFSVARHLCPGCGKNQIFSKYVDSLGQYLDDRVGKCTECSYHYSPKQFFEESKSTEKRSISLPKVQKYKTSRPPSVNNLPPSFIPVEEFKASLKVHETNNFVQFLIDLFGVDVASELVSRYFIATSKHWNGATVFWQIDAQGKIRTGKIMLYSSTTGKRVKEPFNHINWVHKFLKQPEFELKQCLFGEHLLIDKTKPVAIVESEKTAVIASVYLPQFIWVAVGSLTNLKAEKCRTLIGRTVTLFPDLNGFEKWSSKAKELSHLAKFTISNLLERKASEAERKQGFDLADYLIKYNYKEFVLPLSEATEPSPTVQPFVEVKPFEQPAPFYYSSKPEPPKSEPPKPDSWEHDVNELENYFAGIALPTQPVKLNPYSTITNCSIFIERHFETIKAYNGKPSFLPYLNRLTELKYLLTINSN